jgi:replicative DNA helicase
MNLHEKRLLVHLFFDIDSLSHFKGRVKATMLFDDDVRLIFANLINPHIYDPLLKRFNQDEFFKRLTKPQIDLWNNLANEQSFTYTLESCEEVIEGLEREGLKVKYETLIKRSIQEYKTAPDNVHNIMEKLKLELTMNTNQELKFIERSEGVKRTAKEIKDHIEGNNPFRLPTPWETLNLKLNGGIGLGELTVIASKTNMGKTMLASQIMTYLSLGNVKGAVIGLEMTPQEYIKREMSYIADEFEDEDFSPDAVNNSTLQNPKHRNFDYEQFQKVSDFLSNEENNNLLYLDSIFNLTTSGLETMISKAAILHECKVVLVDHSLLVTHSYKDNIGLGTKEVIEACAKCAKDLNIAVIVVNQMNRDSKVGTQAQSGGTYEKVDAMSGGRAVEQTANTLLIIEKFLYPGDLTRAIDEAKDLLNGDGFGGGVDQRELKNAESQAVANAMENSPYTKISIAKARGAGRGAHIVTKFKGVNSNFVEMIPEDWQTIKGEQDLNAKYIYKEPKISEVRF